jgi:pyruvate formate lyase activating enzyme
VDPVEKKPLNHFYPGSAVLSFGTAGCNLGCKFCQNWAISKSREWDRLTDRASPETIARKAEELGCAGVAFTYNDPVIFTEYAMDTADACHERGIKTVAVTAGYINDPARGDLFSRMDAANVDLKAFTERFYRRVTLSGLAPVLETLKFIKHETGTWLEITNLLIPGENDSYEEIRAMAGWIARELGPGVPLHFTAFHPDFRMLDKDPTPVSTLRKARRIALSAGLRYVYTGNVRDPDGSGTRCHACGGLLVERDGYTLGEYRIRNGRCPSCGTVCAGHFPDRPGNWGARRLPVKLGTELNP